MYEIYEETGDNFSTNISCPNRYGTVTISIPKDDITLTEFVDRLVVPMLLGVGYSPKAIGEVIDSDMVG